jgi:hypothetical protein
MTDAKPTIAILGAGPTGLEAALAAADGGHPFILFEAAPSVAGNVRAWGHVRLFTPWDLNVSPRMRRHLEAGGVEVPSGTDCPTGQELAERLLDPIAGLREISPNLRLGTQVLAVGREGLLKHEEIATPERGRRPFRILVAEPGGRERVHPADVVIDTTGTWSHPNSLGDGGIPTPGERAFDGEIRRHIPDLTREEEHWAGKTILVAGSGHSAQTAIRDLAFLALKAPGTHVIWVLRNLKPDWGTHDGDPLPERESLAGQACAFAEGMWPTVISSRRGMVVEEIAKPNGRFEVTLRNGARRETVSVDRILSLTGSVGDHSLYRQLQVHECYATCGPIKLSAALLGAGASDCLAQTTHGADTLTNPEPGFYILGSKSYGRNNTFLMRIGWEQVGEVFGAL